MQRNKKTIPKIIPSTIITRYKYVITQPIAIKTLDDAINSWLSKSDYFITLNGTSLYVSPIYEDRYERFKLIQIHIDIDKMNIHKVSQQQWQNLIEMCHKYDLYPVYSGKTGIHLYSTYLIYIDNRTLMAVKGSLSEYIYYKRNIKPRLFASIVDGQFDKIVGITLQPTPRLGYRNDTKRFIIPFAIYDGEYDYELFQTIVQVQEYSEDKVNILQNLLVYKDLQQFINKYIFPMKIVTL